MFFLPISRPRMAVRIVFVTKTCPSFASMFWLGVWSFDLTLERRGDPVLFVANDLNLLSPRNSKLQSFWTRIFAVGLELNLNPHAPGPLQNSLARIRHELGATRWHKQKNTKQHFNTSQNSPMKHITGALRVGLASDGVGCVLQKKTIKKTVRSGGVNR